MIIQCTNLPPCILGSRQLQKGAIYLIWMRHQHFMDGCQDPRLLLTFPVEHAKLGQNVFWSKGNPTNNGTPVYENLQKRSGIQG